MTRHLVVLGGSGQLATALSEAAPRRGWQLSQMDRTIADFLDPDAACAALRDCGQFDAVINAAAYNQVDAAESDRATAMTVNAETPGRLAEVCRAVGRPFLHVSTDFVFPGRPGGQYSETDTPAPLNAYGDSKLAGERAVLAASPQHGVFRTSWVYNATHQNFVTTMLGFVGRKDRLSVVNDQVGSPTHAKDLAAGLLIAADRLAAPDEEGGLYHLSARGSVSRANLARFIFARAATRLSACPQVDAIGSDAWPAAARRPGDASLDSAHFQAVFGHALPGWEVSVAQAVDAWCESSLNARANS